MKKSGRLKMRKSGYTAIALFFCLNLYPVASQKTKVACIGDSVTFGYGLENRDKESYPSILGSLLGGDFDVGNFGYSGATLLEHGHRPYIEQEIYKKALSFDADIVIIHLGLNDTDPRNWPNYGREFIPDYLRLIDSFRNSGSDPEIWICRMTPIFPWHHRFVWSTRDYFLDIQKAIEKAAGLAGVKLIDLHAPLYSRPDLFKDSVHPSAEGAGIMAETVYSHISGDFGGLKVADVFTENMVIQRDRPIRVWGSADAGTRVTVAFDRMKNEARAEHDGKWCIELDALDAGGPYELVISAAEKKVKMPNILVGDVWICSGQSNMAFPLKREEHFDRTRQNYKNAGIRFLNRTTDIWPAAGEFNQDQLDRLNRGDYYFPTAWMECDEESAAEFSAVGYYFGKILADSTGVPIGLLHNSIGGSTTESWISRKTLEKHEALVHLFDDFEKNEMIMKWARIRAGDNLKGADNPYQQHPFKPAYLYEQAIEPVEGLAFKGVIWYQGESNAENVMLHEEEFKTMVADWRKNLGNGSFPFYYAQLSSINRPTWGEFRHSQRELMDEIDNCGMAVISDLGHPTNVHPTNKKDVGERLARWALSRDYGKAVVYSGPLYKGCRIIGRKAIVSFEYAAGGLATRDNQKLTGFEIAGLDGRFVAARAEIRGCEVLVWSEVVREPVSVRYAWAPYTDANLENSEGLPASTFTTLKK